MNQTHLTDTEIQQWVLEQTITGAGATHLQGCPHCQAKASGYAMLFKEIEQEPPAVPDFDVTTLVMARLPQPRKTIRTGNGVIYFIVILLTAATGYLFGSTIITLLQGIRTMMLGLVCFAALCVFLFLGYDQFRNYQRQLQHLDQLPVL